jgi:hypothetical protein
MGSLPPNRLAAGPDKGRRSCFQPVPGCATVCTRMIPFRGASLAAFSNRASVSGPREWRSRAPSVPRVSTSAISVSFAVCDPKSPLRTAGLSGERQRPRNRFAAVRSAVSKPSVKAIIDQPEAGDGIGGSAPELKRHASFARARRWRVAPRPGQRRNSRREPHRD